MELESIEQFMYQGLLLRDSKPFFQNFVKKLAESFIVNNMKLLNIQPWSKNVGQLKNDEKMRISSK